MFFALSKLLTFVIDPSIWIIILLIAATFSKKEDRKNKCLRWGLGLLLFFSNGFLFAEFARLWEVPAVTIEKGTKYEAGIVLGGMSSYDEKLNRVQFFRGVDRLLQAIELYRKGTIRKIIFTGGSGKLLHPESKEGVYLKRYFQYFNIPERDYTIESESKNTHENASFTKKLMIAEQIRGKYLLITSAFHMRRSLGCFQKEGVPADPYSTDRYGEERKLEFDHLFIPNISVLAGWTNLIHEMVGYVVYKITGYA